MLNKNYKLLWILDSIQSPETIPLYRFFLENDFNFEQHSMLINLICYYEILLTGHTPSTEKFDMLIRPKISKVCVKKAGDITMQNIHLCISKIKHPLLFDLELESIKWLAPNVYKTLAN